MHVIDIWNGSRTSARMAHEREVLQAVLTATEDDYGPWLLDEHTEDYHGDQESRAFREYGHDMFVTVGGNEKLVGEDKIVVHEPLMKGILGYRILIIREEDSEKFAAIETEEELQQLRVGIPDTWPDAQSFRQSGYNVVERGTYDDMFERLHNDEFDFTALGANEIHGVFADRADEVEGLTMVDHLMVYYPFPLLFYVNPDAPELAERIQKGMEIIKEDGTLDEIFYKHNGELIETIDFEGRTIFRLENPILPEAMAGFESDLLQE